MFIFILTVVPLPTLGFYFHIVAVFFILGRPMPAPKPERSYSVGRRRIPLLHGKLDVLYTGALVFKGYGYILVGYVLHKPFRP